MKKSGCWNATEFDNKPKLCYNTYLLRKQGWNKMFKVFKTLVGQYRVRNTVTGEVVGNYTTVRFATSVANLRNSQAAK